MRVVWLFVAALVVTSSVVSVSGEAKKYDETLHKIKKSIAKQESAGVKKTQEKTTPDSKEDVGKESAIISIKEGKGQVTLNGPISQLLQALFNKQGIVIPGNKVPLDLGQILNALGINTIGIDTLNQILNALGLINIGGTNKLTTVGSIFAILLAIKAGLAAGFAALLGLLVSPIQLINQILAVVAIGLLIAYIVGDKKGGGGYGDDYYDYYDVVIPSVGYASPEPYIPTPTYGVPDTGYGAPDTGYGAPDTGYGAPTGGSSYTSYRRSDTVGDDEPAGRTARSNVLRPILNRVSGMVNEAVDKYSKLYD